ncbi:MAG: glycoside hydrolase family 95 protein [Ruminococcaceae bacterium]|nr:glycoside hydrolase family 95 protein [Oscillospiraceae bacterium]
MREYRLFDTSPATKWLESVPVGNGRMGGTLMCGVSEEVMILNEETVWSSQPGGEANPEMPAKLETIKQLFREGKPAEADKLANTLLSDCFTRIRSYETAGQLKISLHENDHCRDYRHELDLMRGIAKVEYTHRGTHYVRECFSSYPDNVIVYRVTSDGDALDAEIGYDREHTLSKKADGNELCIIARTICGNHKFCVKIRVITDGTVTANSGSLFVSDTNEFTVLVNIATEFRHGESFEDAVIFPSNTDYNALRLHHEKDFLSVMSRADIKVPEALEMEDVSMPLRIHALTCNRPNDGGLVMMVWQFGRYLLTSSSRPGTLPANLQGMWVDKDVSPWSSDYHTNINLQMNYWPAEVANLSDCHMQLFDYMKNFLLESGKKTAKTGYNARGSVVHHLSDIYGFTSPADGLWGIWPHGLSWLCFHLWEHWLFTRDEEFLRDTAYEMIRESSLFFLDTMFEDKKGRLVYAPSSSPENRYWAEDENGEKYACFLAMSSTMDTSIIGGLLRMYINASEILGISDNDTKHAAEALGKLPKLFVGKHGQLAEWIEDYEETSIGHRHFSNTFAFFPDNAITRETPELYKAIEVSLARRLSGGLDSNGQGATSVGWSLTWLTCQFARLRKGNDAYQMVENYITRATAPNLMDHYTKSNQVFQLDANMGYVAGVCEMLIQSHEGFISLLPALPKKWDNGSFRGLRARGGYELDVKWENYEVRDIYITADFDGDVTLELPETQKALKFRDDKGNVYAVKENKLTLDMCKNKRLHIVTE